MGDGAFKHITVTAAEEEDVVIHAGIPSSDTAPESSATDGLAAENSAVETLTPEVPTLEEPAIENAPVIDAPAKKAPTETQTRKVRDDGYRPTTLEDLEGKPMPTIQKAVIIAAIICIIGAIVYYFVFMG